MVLAGLLLVLGISSASVLDSFGVVSGDAEVEGPTFYVANDERLVEGQNFGSDDHFTYSTVDKSTLDYYTREGLPESDWYPMNLTYYLDAELETDAVDSTDVELTLRGKSSDSSYSICTGKVTVTPKDDKDIVSDSCEGILDSEVDELELEINVLADDAEIQYAATGDSKVEVSAQ